MPQSDPVLDLLRDLVAIDSVNPSLVAGGAGEGAIAAHVADVCRRGGLDVQVQEAAPGRPNVIATLEGRAPGRTLMWCGHLDTVGVAGMDAPFAPVVRDGCLYGRGAQDMKGGVAAMVSAAITLAQRGALERGRIVVAAVADEEYASVGAEALVRDWRADAAVVTEPTDLQVGVAHKGFAEIEVETRGVAAHGSRPDIGRDAILRMGRVLGALEQRERQFAAAPVATRLGRPSLHASTIAGGREWSTYPDRCVLQVERRTVTGETGETALREVEALLAALRGIDHEFEGAARLVFSRPPYEIAESAELPQALASALKGGGRPATFAAMTFWTDAALLGHAGIPAVLFGPGGAGLHGNEEYVKLDEVVACRDILVDLAARYC
jgi:acetylornithine deacetylase